jgi:hypothetical protein
MRSSLSPKVDPFKSWHVVPSSMADRRLAILYVRLECEQKDFGRDVAAAKSTGTSRCRARRQAAAGHVISRRHQCHMGWHVTLLPERTFSLKVNKSSSAAASIHPASTKSGGSYPLTPLSIQLSQTRYFDFFNSQSLDAAKKGWPWCRQEG